MLNVRIQLPVSSRVRDPYNFSTVFDKIENQTGTPERSESSISLSDHLSPHLTRLSWYDYQPYSIRGALSHMQRGCAYKLYFNENIRSLT